VCSSHRGIELGQAKVNDAHVALGIELQVGRFDVAVNDANGMGGSQPFGGLGANPTHFSAGKRPLFPEALGDGFAPHIFHHEIGQPVGFPDFVQGGDVGMVEARYHPRFPQKTLAGFRLIGIAGFEHLDGDLAPQFGIAGQKHLSHTAAAKPLDDLETSQVGRHRRWPLHAKTTRCVLCCGAPRGRRHFKGRRDGHILTAATTPGMQHHGQKTPGEPAGTAI
jgi:hypothetical protein